MTLLAYHYVLRLQVKRGTDAPALAVSQVRTALQVVWPKPEFISQAALEELARVRQRNRPAYYSHKKRHRRERNSLPPN